MIAEAFDLAGSDQTVSYPPWNFSWIIEKKLAAFAWPQTEDNLEWLVDQGVHHLVTLSPEKQPPIMGYSKMEWTLIPIDEFYAPSLRDINKFIDVCQRAQIKNQGIGVHCRMGRGRTGVMLACYLVHFQGLTPERAITEIRLLRPGSIETFEQEQAVKKYHDYLRGSTYTETEADKSPDPLMY